MTPTLDDRGAQVLRLVVEDYIKTAEPVGSRPILKKKGEGTSPAPNPTLIADRAGGESAPGPRGKRGRAKGALRPDTGRAELVH